MRLDADIPPRSRLRRAGDHRHLAGVGDHLTKQAVGDRATAHMNRVGPEAAELGQPSQSPPDIHGEAFQDDPGDSADIVRIGEGETIAMSQDASGHVLGRACQPR